MEFTRSVRRVFVVNDVWIVVVVAIFFLEIEFFVCVVNLALIIVVRIVVVVVCDFEVIDIIMVDIGIDAFAGRAIFRIVDQQTSAA